MSLSATSMAQQGANHANTAEALDQSDPLLRITSPISGAVFAPGETFTVDVSVDASIQPLWVSVGMRPWVIEFDYTAPFQTPVVVPSDFAGQTELQALALDAGDNEFLSEPITLLVRPTTAPIELSVDDVLVFSEPPEPNVVSRVWVRGTYAGGVQIDLSSSAAGTTFVSTDPRIATVDAEGHVTAVSAGATFIASQNNGVSAFTTVRVVHKGPFPPTLDVTRQLRIEQSALRFDAQTDRFVQTVTITNDGATPIPGHLALMLDSLPEEVNWTNHSGITRNLLPIGADYTYLDFANGVYLAPGEAVNVALEFMDPGTTPITYSPRVSQTETP